MAITFWSKWWTYQRERFPVFAHGMLVIAFSFSAVSFSSLLRGEVAIPKLSVLGVAFLSSFIFFLLLRIADEFKDFEDDSEYRPYRAVPRGLVSLRELGWLALGILVIQFSLAVWLNINLLVPLFITWIYLALMTKEFFVAEWLKKSPITYMWSHMLIMPLIDFYATAVEWMDAGLSVPPDGLFWFLIVSFFNGLVIEIGRKIRAPQDEEEGVETYSVLWGRKKAVLVWIAAMIVTAVSAGAAAMLIDFFNYALILLSVLVIVAVIIALRFIKQPDTKRAKMIENMSGIWTLLMYLSLGVIPLALQYFKVI